jgi:hypothetical protein
MSPRIVALALSVLSIASWASAQGPGVKRPIEPTSSYQVRTIHGFRVLFSARLLEHKSEADEVLDELSKQLEAISKVVPAEPLRMLRRVPFWVERDFLLDKAALFRPSAENLRARGENPDKAGGVEVSNARNFVDWSRKEQPFAALHELAHAYHFHVIGYSEPAVLQAYQNAKESGLYARVKYVNGGEQPGYAATNPQEYFAELSEAYFGKNDFYPFTRAELKEYDAVGYQLMQQAWGTPRGETARSKARGTATRGSVKSAKKSSKGK